MADIETIGGYGQDINPDGSYIPEGWKVMAEVDDSEDYSIDIVRVYLLPDARVALATASGCSCWEGDWSVERFDDLDALWTSLTQDDRTYGTNLPTNAELKKQVTKWQAANP